MRCVGFFRMFLLCGCVLLFSGAVVPGPEYKRPISAEPNFVEGEFLQFNIGYGLLNGGKVQLSVDKEVLNGTTYFHSKAYGYTSGVVDAFFRVRDVYESWFDIQTNIPVKGIRNVREGRYRHYDEFTYFHDQEYVQSSRKGRVEVPRNALDMTCVFYYMRRIDFSRFQVGDIVYMDTYFNGKHFPFYVQFRGREEVSLPLGTFRTLKFVPVVEPGRIFKKKDDMTIWFSDDENKIPLRVQFDAVVGSFKCDLESYRNLKFPLRSKIR